jgi:hypothetical protein
LLVITAILSISPRWLAVRIGAALDMTAEPTEPLRVAHPAVTLR